MLVFVVFAFVDASQAVIPQANAGWKTLFDGSSMRGWKATGNANWKIADGVLQADSGRGYLVTEEVYGDFQLKAEFWVDADANSGIYIRCSNPQEITDRNSYEVNIFDKRPDQTYRTGAIANVAPPLANINAAGQWNTFEITAEGSHLVVTLNGTKTVDTRDSMHARGNIALQYFAGVVKFRNVQIRPL